MLDQKMLMCVHLCDLGRCMPVYICVHVYMCVGALVCIFVCAWVYVFSKNREGIIPCGVIVLHRYSLAIRGLDGADFRE